MTADALVLHLFSAESYLLLPVPMMIQFNHAYIDGLVQERRYSSALAMLLRLFSTNPSIWFTRLQYLTGDKPLPEAMMSQASVLSRQQATCINWHTYDSPGFNSESPSFSAQQATSHYLNQWRPSSLTNLSRQPLALSRQHAITWTNDDPVHWYIFNSPGFSAEQVTSHYQNQLEIVDQCSTRIPTLNE